MLFFKITDGPEILIHDGINEGLALEAIGQWIWECHKDATDATGKILRAELLRDRLVIRFKKSATPEEAAARSQYAWWFILQKRLASFACTYAIGLDGSQTPVPKPGQGPVAKARQDRVTEAMVSAQTAVAEFANSVNEWAR